MLDPIKFTVKDIGDFTSRHRTLSSQIQIERSYMDYCGGDPEKAPESLQNVALMKAQLDALLDQTPDGFNIESATLYDSSSVYLEMRAAEARFLEALEKGRQGQGQGAK